MKNQNDSTFSTQAVADFNQFNGKWKQNFGGKDFEKWLKLEDYGYFMRKAITIFPMVPVMIFQQSSGQIKIIHHVGGNGRWSQREEKIIVGIGIDKQSDKCAFIDLDETRKWVTTAKWHWNENKKVMQLIETKFPYANHEKKYTDLKWINPENKNEMICEAIHPTGFVIHGSYTKQI